MPAELFSSQSEMKQCPRLGNEDRISELPEALLLQILSSIPTKEAVATSVLSKRWRFLFKMMPNLSFYYKRTNDLKRFSDNVCRCLLSHQAPVLQSLHLQMRFQDDSTMDTGVMNLIMGIAFGLRVREFELGVFLSDDLYSFPTSLFNGETLETLKLDGNVLVDVPFPVCLKSLRTLRLHGVSFKDDGSVANLLSGCSILENLEVMLYQHSGSGVKTVTIAVPSLQSLTLTILTILTSSNIAEFTDPLVYVINSPSLKHLKIVGITDVDSCLIENMPELVDADIYIVWGVIYEKIHGSLTSVKRLSLKIGSPLDDLTKFSNDRIFDQLVYLEIHTYEPEWWNLLMIMLDSSPNLQLLKLINDENYRELSCKRWSQPEYVAECLLNRLETFVWEKYDGEIEDEKEVAQYILMNACRLKTATFSRRTRTDIQPEKRLEWYKELETVDRASNSCQIVFK